MYLSVRIESWDILIKKRKWHPSQGDSASTARACRVGRGAQGEARPAISAPRGGPHLDIGRVRLKTWSQSDLSIAGTTWATISSTYLLSLSNYRVSLWLSNYRKSFGTIYRIVIDSYRNLNFHCDILHCPVDNIL